MQSALQLHRFAPDLGGFEVRFFSAFGDVGRIPELEVEVDVVYEDDLGDFDSLRLWRSPRVADLEVELEVLYENLEEPWFAEFDSEAAIDVVSLEMVDDAPLRSRGLHYVFAFGLVVFAAACVGANVL